MSSWGGVTVVLGGFDVVLLGLVMLNRGVLLVLLLRASCNAIGFPEIIPHNLLGNKLFFIREEKLFL